MLDKWVPKLVASDYKIEYCTPPQQRLFASNLRLSTQWLWELRLDIEELIGLGAVDSSSGCRKVHRFLCKPLNSVQEGQNMTCLGSQNIEVFIKICRLKTELIHLIMAFLHQGNFLESIEITTWIEFLYSPCSCLSFLWILPFPHTLQRHADKLIVFWLNYPLYLCKLSALYQYLWKISRMHTSMYPLTRGTWVSCA